MNPLISVIMPCHSDGLYIAQAIKAVQAQTYTNWELIIVDDHSIDNTAKIVESFVKDDTRIRYVFLEEEDTERINKKGDNINAGWLARNYGMSLANGELITFQDADDGSHTNRFEIQLYGMEKYKSDHVVVDWRKYSDDLNETVYDVDIDTLQVIDTDTILKTVQKNKKGFFKYPFSRNEDNNYLSSVAHRFDRKYLRSWDSYPLAASMPLFRRSVLGEVRFRQLYERVWPSGRGRGADRDFNFWLAETCKTSIGLEVPLVLWRHNGLDNKKYVDRN
ncbi:MAG: hypothetical protein CO029_00690 [Candidatus Magasanikbacteria bacterium CG_4_9_14_0_2_um_filter_41_10]|nr:MAG: hypothetical protein AUJ37_01355 [Candidatus Magasanikbacteria bacterium CG1_02_41_34]PJC53820.1 MAG: hypothetical protein CO029_00690 [Candidatus Magasanikbacteria bacterium CG_4_9_14_0_2_um_filter_41_10]